MEFFRNILRNYSVYSAWLPRRDPVKAESCRSLYPQTSPRASQKGRLLDSDGKREKQSVPWCVVRSELFPLEFWLHLWGNAKGVRDSEPCRSNVSKLAIIESAIHAARMFRKALARRIISKEVNDLSPG